MQKKILIVDDEPHILKMVENRLKFSGYETITAQDGNEGLKKAQEQKPHLILLDILMPGMNGFQTLKKLKEQEDTRNIPVIILTAKGQPQDVEEAINLGASDYVVKPFTPIVLLEKINKVLEGPKGQ